MFWQTCTVNTALFARILSATMSKNTCEMPVSKELSQDFISFAVCLKKKKLSGWNLSEAQIETAVELIQAAIAQAYGGSMNKLLERDGAAGENVRFSNALMGVADGMPWKTGTKQKHLRTVRRILKETPLQRDFVDSLRFDRARPEFDRIIGKKYGSDGSPAHIRQRLTDWVDVLRTETASKTAVSLRTIMSFLLNQCLPRLGLSLENWPEDPRQRVLDQFEKAPDVVSLICGPPRTELSKKKAAWLSVFLNDILHVSQQMPDEYFLKPRATKSSEDDCEGDLHRISSADLEKIHEQCQHSARDELIFMLFITTGTRIGGVAQIKISSVADLVDEEYRVRTQGRTREKGGKWCSFFLTDRVQELMGAWLQNHRPASGSSYLFPGSSSGHISVETIRKTFQKHCARAGLQGKEFHPHALRHTFAHLLLEAGNSVDVIAKCLHHNNSHTTEKYYLRESIEEVTDRAVIPWHQTSARKQTQRLPAFLDKAGGSEKEEHAAKKQKLELTMSRLDAL